MTALHYKDFQGSVEFEDGKLVVQILHIDDSISTYVDGASQAQAAFEELVDDYVETCRAVGKEPCKPFKGSFNVRIEPELHRQIAMAAVESRQTMNAWVATALEARIERQKEKKADHHLVVGFIGRELVSENNYTLVKTLQVRDLSQVRRVLPASQGNGDPSPWGRMN
jgi:predicted HicB family RNase H-like nuclease